MFLPQSCLPLKRFIQEFPPWGFFQTHLHPAVISVSAFCYLGLSTPKLELPAAEKRWLHLDPAHGGRGRCLPDPVIILQHPVLSHMHALSLFCLPWDPGSYVHACVFVCVPSFWLLSTILLLFWVQLIILVPFVHSLAQSMGASLLKSVSRPWALGTYLVSNPRSLIS